MEVVERCGEARDWVAARRAAGERIALVPTMGFLHEGHASLLTLARRHADRVALSIFVNPLQFGPAEDFETYPRDLDRDLGVARQAGVDFVFAPSVVEMYPQGKLWVAVVPQRGAELLCGKSRPDHFTGVLTVVAKLFGILDPDVAVFGRKDFQQLALIRRMVADLDMRVRIVPGPTVRDPAGLALSSRNRYLSNEDRRQALSISGALRDCHRLFAQGERDAAVFRRRMLEIDSTRVAVEYAEVVDRETLEPVQAVGAGTVCAIAARVGDTRLIDNTELGNGPGEFDVPPEAEAVITPRRTAVDS